MIDKIQQFIGCNDAVVNDFFMLLAIFAVALLATSAVHLWPDDTTNY